jgi:disulfide bond formation protein DsbB
MPTRDVLRRITPLKAAGAVLALSVLTLAGAWIFEWFGYLPCDLCLKQRWPYYAGIPLAGLTALAVWRGPRGLAMAGLALLGLLWTGSAIFGVYHSGVEWGWWPGPTGCSGSIGAAPSVADFLKQLETVRVVRCDEVAIRILGLSLAGWNAVISAFMAVLALVGARASR